MPVSPSFVGLPADPCPNGDRPFLGASPVGVGDLLKQVVHGEPGRSYSKRSGLHPGHIQEILDEAVHALGRALYGLEVLPPFFRRDLQLQE